MSAVIPRLSMAELDPDLAELLRPKVERLDYLGEFFQCTGHQPRALISFCTLTEDLKKALPDNLTELVALTIATKRSEEHTSELQSLRHLVCRLLLEKKTSRRAAPAPLPPARD